MIGKQISMEVYVAVGGGGVGVGGILVLQSI